MKLSLKYKNSIRLGVLLLIFAGILVFIYFQLKDEELNHIDLNSLENDFSSKEKNNINDTALVRLEQLFPLPELEIQDVLNKYSNAKDIVWAQEEPRNMGAWSYLLLHFDKARDFRVASRRFYSSPAAGSSTRSKNRHNEVIEYVFDKSKNNMK